MKMTQIFKNGAALGVTPIQLEQNPAGFEEGMKVKVSGLSKGRGFAGVVKRHGFSGGRKTHGNKHHERTPGSIGAGTGMGRVIPGLRMAGRMGMERFTFKNIKVVEIDLDNKQIFLNGSAPGTIGRKVEIVAPFEAMEESPATEKAEGKVEEKKETKDKPEATS